MLSCSQTPRSTATIKQIKIGINLWKPEISKLIFQLVETHGNKQESERVRAWLNDPDTIPTRGFTVSVTLVGYAVDNVSGSMMCLGKLGQYRIPLFPIVKGLLTREVDFSEKEKIAEEYIRDLFKDATYKDDLKELYKKLKRARSDAIRNLRDIADEMSDERKNANIAKAVASPLPIIGTAAAVGVTTLGIVNPGDIAVAVARATAAVGSAAGVTGGATHFGADIVAGKLAERAETKSEQILMNQAKSTEDFIKLLNEYKEHTENHLETAKMLGDVLVRFKKLHETRVRVTMGIGDSVEEELGFVKSFMKETKLNEGRRETIVKVVTIGGEVITRVIGAEATAATETALNMVDDVARLLTYSAKVANVVAGVAVIGIDIYSIVKTARELNEGSPDKAAENIREAAKELERTVLPELEDVITQTRLEAAEKGGVEEVAET